MARRPACRPARPPNRRQGRRRKGAPSQRTRGGDAAHGMAPR
jgi:hypothetical protein